MKYEDTQLLQRWVTLHLAIAAARSARELGHAPAASDGAIVTPETIFESRAYKAVRKWFAGLSRGGRVRTRTWMTTQLDGVAKLRARLEAQGDTFNYADLDELGFEVHETAGDVTGETKERSE